MNRFFSKGIVLPVLVLMMAACEKDPGPGGLATVKGKVFGTDLTTSLNIRDSGYVGDQRVFIAVSGDPAYFDDMRTSYAGSYEFKFLRKGKYDIWAYSDCDTCIWKQQKVMLQGIEISDKKQTVTAPDLKIIF